MDQTALNGARLGYYPAGYELDGTVERTKRTPRVQFRYRPMGAGVTAQYQRRLDKAKGDKEVETRILFDIIAGHVSWWDLKRPQVEAGEIVRVDGKPVLVTVDQTDAKELANADWYVLNAVAMTIYAPSPVDPEEKKDQDADAKN